MGSGVLRVLHQRGWASILLWCSPMQLFGGDTHQRKWDKLWSTEQGSYHSVPGAVHSPRNVPGRRGFHPDPVGLHAGIAAKVSLLSAGGGDEAEEREGVAQWWGWQLAGPLPLHTEGR